MSVSPTVSITIDSQMDLALFLHAVPHDNSAASCAEDTLTLNLSNELLRNPSDSFATYARDDNLNGVGIHEGDLLIVDRKLKPQHHEVVVISLDGELLCRVLDMQESCLTTTDPQQGPLFLNEHASLVIEGVVINAVKRFR